MPNKTIPTSVALTIILILAILVGIMDYWFYQEIQSIKFEIIELKSSQKNLTFDPLNATYKIEGEEFTLVNGKAEKEIVPGAASKIEVMVWSAPAVGDLSADGTNDAALILTYSGGGSGNFYYIAATFKNLEDGKIIGTNAILLGDRIALENISIKTGVIIVNYADRRIDESMITQPSIGITKQFALEGTTLKDITPEEAKKEQACEISGGTVKTSLCCASASDFPNLCLIGACGCSPTNSHQVKVCDCGANKCFNESGCVVNQ